MGRNFWWAVVGGGGRVNFRLYTNELIILNTSTPRSRGTRANRWRNYDYLSAVNNIEKLGVVLGSIYQVGGGGATRGIRGASVQGRQ